jgi:hypothetical protein
MTLTSFPNARRLRRVAGQGRACRFFVLDGIGHKVYWERGGRDYLFAMQDYLYHLGFAPRVGNTFEVRHQRQMCFGYTTEVAEQLVDAANGFCDANGDNVWEQFSKRPDHDQLKAEIEGLHARLRKVGIEHSDHHPGNYGLINGKVMILDYEGFKITDQITLAA